MWINATLQSGREEKSGNHSIAESLKGLSEINCNLAHLTAIAADVSLSSVAESLAARRERLERRLILSDRIGNENNEIS